MKCFQLYPVNHLLLLLANYSIMPYLFKLKGKKDDVFHYMSEEYKAFAGEPPLQWVIYEIIGED